MKNNYLKYTTMGFEMMATIVIGLVIGIYMDKYFNMSKPYFSATFSFIFVLIAMYRALKDFIFPPKE